MTGTIRIWELQTGQVLEDRKHHAGKQEAQLRIATIFLFFLRWHL
jgi:hypothetical protein